MNRASWLGFGVLGLAVLPALGGCKCALGSVYASRSSDTQLVYSSCLLMGEGGGLVSPGIFWCGWCNLYGVGLGAPELTWNVSYVVVSSLVLMLESPKSVPY